MSAAVRAAFQDWIRRRGPVHPPLELGYRQIYILPTRFGWAIGVLLTAMLLGSLNFNNNLGLFTTFLVAGMGVISMHAAHRNLDGLRIVGCAAQPVFAGQPIRLHATLKDATGRARRGLVLVGDADRRSTGVDVEAFGAVDAMLELPTQQRGWMEAPRIRLRTRYPLGWFEAWSWFWPERSLLVWPKPAADAPPLPREAKSEHSPLPGDESDEFHGLRDWREGDPLHRIAWKSSQRHGNLLARQFTRPDRDRTVLRLADAPGRDVEQRIGILARWIIEADRQHIDYGLETGAATIAPAHGPAHRARCLTALAECE